MSVLDLRRQLAAVGGELGHHLLVQPDVHAGGIIGVAGVAELLGKLLARREAGVEVESLHQIDDGVLPVQLLLLGRDRLVEDGSDVDCLRRGCRGSCGRAAGCGATCSRATRRRGAGLAAEDRIHDRPENTHASLPINLKMPWRFVALSWLTGSTWAGARCATLLHRQLGCQCDNHRSLSKTSPAIGSTLTPTVRDMASSVSFRVSGLIVIALRERRSSALRVARDCGRLLKGRRRPWPRHIKEMSQMSLPPTRREYPSFAASAFPTCIVRCSLAGKISRPCPAMPFSSA